jgi:CheY-like chemotaxis protein
MTTPSNARILLVEDEMILAWMLKDMLEDLGHSVVGPVSNVREALETIKTNTIDAVILDVNLNGEMSYPVADLLTTRGVPFMLSTAYRQDRLPEAYQKSHILQKPYHPSELGDKIIQLLAVGNTSVAGGGHAGSKPSERASGLRAH